jgi:hypothetical protein
MEGRNNKRRSPMKKMMFTISALAIAILAVVPSLALAKIATNHDQTQLRG